MQHLLIILFVIILILLIVYFMRKQKKITNVIQPISESEDYQVMIETLPIDTNLDNNNLVEIKDNKVLARINNAIPQIGQAANDAKDAIKASKEVLYRVILPKGKELVKSKNIENAVRGFYTDSKGIKGHANLVAVNQKGATIANAASSAMSVASMVVGQYYMSQINNEMIEINNNIDKIATFQNSEYKSKLMALSSQIKKISSYESEILENDELRRDEIQNLNRLEQECLELLGQANLMIEKIYKKNIDNYKQYQEEIVNAQSWYSYQNILLDLLYKISNLKHALYLGEVSINNCSAYLSSYTNQVIQSQKLLTEWHENIAKSLDIQIESKRIKRRGWDGAIHSIPGFFDDNYNFKTISESTINMILNQTRKTETSDKEELIDLYHKDVELICKDGKVYYLPEGEKKCQE